jgi:iron(III) transport system substrate-binding protein
VKRSKRLGVLVGAVVTALALSGCGGSVTASSSDGGGITDTATAALADINKQLEGLDPAARREKLIELAKDEGGTVSFYGSTTPKDMDPVVEAFEEATGLKVNVYRASAAEIVQRVQQEGKANFRGADAIVTGDSDSAVLEGDHLLAKVETPIASEIYDGGVSDHGIAMYRTVRITPWNTDRVKTPPTSWEDLFENFKGEVVVDPTDWDWFYALTQEYFIKKKGMTEDEAIAYWKKIGPNLVKVKGHSLATQFVVTGEYSISAVSYHDSLPTATEKKAPVGWEPPLWPAIVSPTLVSVSAAAKHPASALLFLEYVLTDGQAILAQGGRTTTNVNVKAAWPSKYDNVLVTMPTEVGDPKVAEKWQALFEEVLNSSKSGD